MLFDFMKFIGLHIGLSFSFLKITNYKEHKSRVSIFLLLINIIFAFIQCSFNLPYIFKLIVMCFSYTIIFKFLTKLQFEKCFIGTIISLSISLITLTFSTFIVVLFFSILKFSHYTNPIFTISSSIVSLITLYLLFKINRLKNGIPILSKSQDTVHISIFILIINAIIIFTYFLISSFNSISIQNLLFGFVLFVFVLIILLQKTFILYQKQKLQTDTLKDYEHQLSETQQKLQTALAEKQTLIKSNHEFYHRQEALNKKIDDLANQFSSGSKTEFSEDYGNIVERINNLSDEYVSKTKTTPTLPKCGIVELDDMLNYMKSECDKNNIEFILNIDCDVNYMIDNYISKSQLETLLGDLIRNSIIAVNHSSNDCKSIMVVLGIKDESYELCVLDNGIPFEIDTLLNLGLVPSSTHLNEGGSGIGFITTFETLKSCKASFVITELTNNTYTKSLEIKFDNKLQYVIISDRHDEIKSCNKSNRDIIIKEN